MALLLKTDNTREEVEPRHGREFTLRELQNYVGGYVDVVPLSDNRILIINGQGHMLDLTANFSATLAAERSIVGDALLCRMTEVQ